MKRYVAALASFCSLYFIVFESLLTTSDQDEVTYKETRIKLHFKDVTLVVYNPEAFKITFLVKVQPGMARGLVFVWTIIRLGNRHSIKMLQ